MSLDEVRARLQNLSTDQFSGDSRLSKAPGYSQSEFSGEVVLKTRGYRQLSQVSRLPERAQEGLVGEFGSLQELMKAIKTQLTRAEGVGRRGRRTFAIISHPDAGKTTLTEKGTHRTATEPIARSIVPTAIVKGSNQESRTENARIRDGAGLSR